MKYACLFLLVWALATSRLHAQTLALAQPLPAANTALGYALTLPLTYTRHPLAYAITAHYVVPMHTSTKAEAEVLRPAAYASFHLEYPFR